MADSSSIVTQQADEPFYLAQTASAIQPGQLNMLGFGFDGTACFRKGTRNGPDGLRQVSDGIESYSPYLDKDIEDHPFFDLGNLSLGNSTDIEQQWLSATQDWQALCAGIDLPASQTRILTLGGEHSISYAPIKTYLQQYPDLVVIHLDAHADLRDGYEGYHYSHASIIRRALDHFGEQHQLIQYGIRSGTREEYQWMRENQTLCTCRQAFLQRVEHIASTRPVYLTLDLDYFDPSFLPGTGTPEPGGEDFHSYIALVKKLMNKNLVGADVVELSPEIDPTGNSSVFAAKVVRELIICLTQGNTKS